MLLKSVGDRARDCLDILDAMSVLSDEALYRVAYEYFTDAEAVEFQATYGTLLQGSADRMNRIMEQAINNRATASRI